MAGMELRIEQRVNDLYLELDRIQQRAVRPALNAAIRHTVRRTATETKRSTARELGVAQKYLKKRIRWWNHGIRNLSGKVWIGFGKKIGVNTIRGATQALAERHKEFSTPVFPMRLKNGRYIWVQRKGSDRKPTAEPKLDYEASARKHMLRNGREIIRKEFDRVVGRTLKGLLERRGLFDLRALRATRDFTESTDFSD